MRGGAEILAFVDAAHDVSAPVDAPRDALVAALGAGPAERVVGVAATFQMMNRLLDGVGAPVKNKRHFVSVADSLGFDLADLDR